MTVGIIGGGASGMIAALAAAENPNVQVVLFERQARVGRKLQATGNGRCNLTNIHASGECYHGEDPSFVAPALQALNANATIALFHKLGLITVTEPSGRVYPYSDQANSVVDILRFALQKPNITLHTGFEVQKIRHANGVFTVEGAAQAVTCDKLIIACGGLAGAKLGGSMSGYKLLSKFGHRSTRLRPALVQLKADWSGFAALKGVRTNCHVQIFRDTELFTQSTGELQFTEYGLSGPVIFEVSRDVCSKPGQWSCRLDFLPQYTATELFDLLACRRHTDLPLEELLTGILHNRLGRVLTKAVGISAGQIKDITDEQIQAVCHAVKAFEIALLEPMGMDAAQVTAGGVLTQDFDPTTMESKLFSGLYACGEVLDIDGDCGGYNLQWAWSSGYCAGLHAGREDR